MKLPLLEKVRKVDVQVKEDPLIKLESVTQCTKDFNIKEFISIN